MKLLASLSLLSALLLPLSASAETSSETTPTIESYGPRVPLDKLLSATAKNIDRKFLVSQGVPADVTVGPYTLAQIDYPLLLTVLANNGLTATDASGVLNIVPVSQARLYALPLITDAATAEVPDDLWVTRIIRTRHIDTASLVPILRPMVQREGHMASNGDKALLVADRYANTQRIATLVAELDQAAAPTKTD